MNVFVIPSWYPSQAHPTYGIFCRDQAEALAAAGENVAVSLWGQEEYYLNPRNPGQLLHRLSRYWQSDKETVASKRASGILEIRTPCLEWRHTVFGGNFKSLLAASRKNFCVAQEHLGKIDIIHAHISYPGGVLTRHLANEFRIPYVITEHMGCPFPYPKFLVNGRLFPEMDQAVKMASAVLAVSPHLQKTLDGYGANNVHFVPNVVDEGRFTPVPPSREQFTFFTLCGMSDRKGIPDLLKSIKLVLVSEPSLQFRLGGGGAKLEEYRQMAIDLGLQENVSFLGYLEPSEALVEMQGCHAYIMTSHHENFGVVYAEALACGKPVVATRCQGPECIVTDDNGCLVDVGDIEGIAAAILRMSQNYTTYDKVLIREDFLRRFSRKAVVAKITEIFKTAVEEY